MRFYPRCHAAQSNLNLFDERTLSCRLALAALAAGSSSGDDTPCTRDLDCQLNGACVAGACECSRGWTGASCGELSLAPARAGAGFGSLSSPVSSWGAGAAFDPASGKYVMMVDEMSLGCGLETWGSNSHCVLAMADSPLGPFEKQKVLLDAWCHGSSVARDPASGRWVFMHMGHPQPSVDSCVVTCANGITPANKTTGACEHDGVVPYTQGAFVTVGSDPLGPYVAAPKLRDGANCEPLFLPNGTLFFACPMGGPSSAPNCGSRGQNAFLNVFRAESLDDAIAGNDVELPLTYVPAGSDAPSEVMCINWEDQNLWVDERGFFHTLMHAFRGQNTSYPLPGCFDSGDGRGFQPANCTSLGGHAFSEDGAHWWISPVPAYTSNVTYDDGTVVAFRARERPHILTAADGGHFFISAVGNPGQGGNTGVDGADHTFTLIQQLQ